MSENDVSITVAEIGVYLRQIEINLASIRTSTEIIEKARSDIAELCYNLKEKEDKREEGLTGIVERIGRTKEQILEYVDKIYEINRGKLEGEQELFKEIKKKV